MIYLDNDQPMRPLKQWMPDLAPQSESGHDTESARSKVRCKACLNYLTSNDELTPIQGQTQHFFTNPAGAGFDLQTYQLAPGINLGGSPTEYFSWFEGFAWQHAFCKRCHRHLGWYFSCDGVSGFYGLITDRLLLD